MRRFFISVLSVNPSGSPSMCLSIHLYICLYSHLYVSYPLYVSIHSYARLTVRPSVCTCLYVCLPIHLLRLFVYPSTLMSIRLSVHSSILLSIHPLIYPSFYPSFCPPVLSVHPSFCPPILLSIHPSVHPTSVRPSFCPSILLFIYMSIQTCLSILLYIHLPSCPSVFLFICLLVHLSSCPSVFVSICPSVSQNFFKSFVSKEKKDFYLMNKDCLSQNCEKQQL